MEEALLAVLTYIILNMLRRRAALLHKQPPFTDPHAVSQPSGLIFDSSGRLRPVSRFLSRDWYESSALSWYEHNPREFRRHFRMYPATFNRILSQLPYPTSKPCNPFLKPVTKHMALCIFIYRLAHPCAVSTISTLFGVSDSTVVKCTDHFLDAIAESGMATRYIKWPSDSEIRAAARRFAESRQSRSIPGAFAEVDGTFVKISKPDGDEFKDYTCRKLYYAYNVMGVTDDRGIFISVDIGQVGSMHDQRVFDMSEMPRFGNSIPPGYFVLADSAYSPTTWLLTPYENTKQGLTPAQSLFNNVHSSQRTRVEQAYGRLKGLFIATRARAKLDVFRALAKAQERGRLLNAAAQVPCNSGGFCASQCH